MTDKKEIKKYCSGLDCLTCDEAEPCIYRIANELQEQLKRKEQECEQLKEWQEANQPTGICETCTAKSVEDVYKYKRTLTEIKAIAEEDFDHTCWKTYAGQLKQILQKISEVHND